MRDHLIKIKVSHYGTHIEKNIDYETLTAGFPTSFSRPEDVADRIELFRYPGRNLTTLKKREEEAIPTRPKSLRARCFSYRMALKFGYNRDEADMIADYDWSLNIRAYYRARRKRLSEVLDYSRGHGLECNFESDFRSAAKVVGDSKGHLTIWDIMEGES